MSEVYVPDKDWFSDQFGNELTVDEVDAGAVCVTVEGTDDTMMMNCSGGGGNCSITLTPGQTSALFRYLAGIVLPKVERVEIRSALYRGDVDWRVDGVAYVTRDHRTGEVNTVSANGSQEMANLLACLLAAADEAEGVV